VLDAAGRMQPSALRSLDAIHLATAEQLEDELGDFVTYDERLANAAAAHGFRVAQPR
jgi:predicted nucleic acid-binding protein